MHDILRKVFSITPTNNRFNKFLKEADALVSDDPRLLNAQANGFEMLSRFFYAWELFQARENLNNSVLLESAEKAEATRIEVLRQRFNHDGESESAVVAFWRGLQAVPEKSGGGLSVNSVHGHIILKAAKADWTRLVKKFALPPSVEYKIGDDLFRLYSIGTSMIAPFRGDRLVTTSSYFEGSMSQIMITVHGPGFQWTRSPKAAMPPVGTANLPSLPDGLVAFLQSGGGDAGMAPQLEGLLFD